MGDHGINDDEPLHSTLRINPKEWKKIVAKYWDQSESSDLVPVVVNKKDETFIEWKKPIHFRLCGHDYSVMLSLLFDNNEWQITCMDYDAGRIFYQHRLISDQVNESKYKWSYQDLTKEVTVKLQFDHRCRFYGRW